MSAIFQILLAFCHLAKTMMLHVFILFKLFLFDLIWSIKYDQKGILDFKLE